MPKTIYRYSKRNCNYCQEEYRPTRSNQNCCSKKCANSFQTKYKIISCKTCNIKFKQKYKNHKFCSRSCSAKYNNQKRIDEGWTRSKESRQKTTNSLLICHHGTTKIYSNPMLKKLSGAIASKKEHPDIWGKYSIVYFKNCKHCKKVFLTKTRGVVVCNTCPHTRRRIKYEFSHNVFDYQNLYDNLNELIKFGFFHPVDNKNGMVRDHRVSINEAMSNDYDPYYITHPVNCQLMTQSENKKKYTKSSISYSQLVKEVDEYENSL